MNIRFVRGRLELPPGVTARVGLGLLLLALLNAGMLLITMLQLQGVGDWHRLLSVAALAAFVVQLVQCYRRGGLPMWAATVDLLAVPVVTSVLPDVTPAAGLLFGGLYLRALYGRRCDALAVTAAYVGIVIGTALVMPATMAKLNLPVLIVGVVATAAIIHAVGSLLAHHERSIARERVLSDAGIELAVASTTGDVYAACSRAVPRLLDGPAGLRLVLRSDTGEEVCLSGADAEAPASARSQAAEHVVKIPLAASDGAPQTLCVSTARPLRHRTRYVRRCGCWEPRWVLHCMRLRCARSSCIERRTMR